jgi:dihydrolipoamide dehydrogenase
MFSMLGAKVTIIEMLPEILLPVDEEIAAMMRMELAKKGIEIFTGAKVTNIEPGVTVRFEQGESMSVSADVCIAAAGRRPVTDGLNAEAIGLKMARGFIDVDEYLRTNIPGVYAVGDVTGKIQLAHVASAQGIAAAQNIAGENRKMDYSAVPWCVYTEPEIACAGLKESEARQKGLDIEVGRFPVSANGRSMIKNESAGEVKIISDRRTGEILGCHIMAPRATDMIAEVCAVMRSEGTIEELGGTIHPHPTVSEMVMEAAHDVHGASVHLTKMK